MSIKDWPQGERPREKLLSRGPASLSDAELLAIFLRTGAKGMDAVTLARRLLSQFGSLRQLLQADPRQFCEGPGLGLAKYVQLQASMELMRRFLDEKLVREHALTSPELTRQYLQARLRDAPREVFALLLLDNQHRVIKFHQFCAGNPVLLGRGGIARRRQPPLLPLLRFKLVAIFTEITLKCDA
ncbi:UPF0758 domain-containing protein [Zobellella taiwanensis]